MSDIVKRLQAPAYWISGSNEGHEGENDAPREAADTITRLTAEVERLTVEVEAAKKFGNGFYGEKVTEGVREVYRGFARAALSGDKHE